MKSIKELLKRMNESDSDKFDGDGYGISINSDGSGSIINWNKTRYLSFKDEDAMHKRLNEIEAQLNNEKSNKWEL